MGDVLTWLANNWMLIVGTAGSIVMGASIIVRAIAPLTASTKDDEMAGWLDKVHDWLSKIAINTPPR